MRVVKAQIYNTLKNWSTWIIMLIFLWVQISNIMDQENVKMSLFERNLIFFRIGNAEICAIIFLIISMGKYLKNNFIKNIRWLYEKKERIVLVNTGITLIFFVALYVLNFIFDIIFHFSQEQKLGSKESLGELLSYFCIIAMVVLFTSMVLIITKSQLLAFILGYVALMGKDFIFRQVKIESDMLRNILVSVLISIILCVINRLIAKKIYSVV
ncbi:hypothetical protein [Lachnobacterium bovis]|uniref:Uncharacterized protein n=1 Tax=Lachnobacterium bovis TaxID=140626 RepID=A0A1H9SNU0_9FIRM|nr:hypothetical protein [Lachnobacterium bovis]SER86636.1 hypothetical protein SAMN02910429_01301 [Lachnobacterium bovis]